MMSRLIKMKADIKVIFFNNIKKYIKGGFIREGKLTMILKKDN